MRDVGAFGRLAGVVAITDDAPTPAAVIALTLKKYEEPFVNPLTGY